MPVPWLAKFPPILPPSGLTTALWAYTPPPLLPSPVAAAGAAHDPQPALTGSRRQGGDAPAEIRRAPLDHAPGDGEDAVGEDRPAISRIALVADGVAPGKSEVVDRGVDAVIHLEQPE